MCPNSFHVSTASKRTRSSLGSQTGPFHGSGSGKGLLHLAFWAIYGSRWEIKNGEMDIEMDIDLEILKQYLWLLILWIYHSI